MKNNKQNILIIVLLIILITMSIGFALSNINLTSTGTTTVSKASWKIKFDELSFKETPGSVTPVREPVINESTVTYEIKLAKPGDFYEFMIDSKNTGTFDAVLSSITMSELSVPQQKYLVYKVIYDGNTYTKTTTNLEDTAKTLKATSGKETFKIRVEYILPESEVDLPSEDVALTITTTLLYIQK